jgi:hypothetical protein
MFNYDNFSYVSLEDELPPLGVPVIMAFGDDVVGIFRREVSREDDDVFATDEGCEEIVDDSGVAYRYVSHYDGCDIVVDINELADRWCLCPIP